MAIDDLNAVRQAMANIRLESLELSTKLKELLNKALLEGDIDTTDILKELHG